MTFQLLMLTADGWAPVGFTCVGEEYAEAILQSYRVRFPSQQYCLVEDNISKLEAQCSDYGVGK